MALGRGKTVLATLAPLGPFLVLALSLTPAGRATVPAGKGCMPVSVATTLGTFSYAVRVEAGAAGCGAARAASGCGVFGCAPVEAESGLRLSIGGRMARR